MDKLERIASDPLNTSMPENLPRLYAEIYKLAQATTPQNFAAFRQYVERMKPELQVLYLWQVVGNLPHSPESRESIIRLPEYANWFKNHALAKCLLDGL